MSTTVYAISAPQVDLGTLLGGDLSASRRTPWVCIGRATTLLSLDIATPATGAPTGAYTLECTNDDARSTCATGGPGVTRAALTFTEYTN